MPAKGDLGIRKVAQGYNSPHDAVVAAGVGIVWPGVARTPQGELFGVDHFLTRPVPDRASKRPLGFSVCSVSGTAVKRGVGGVRGGDGEGRGIDLRGWPRD